MNVQTSAEFNSLLPEQKFDRRNFLVTSLAAGFALAVQPVSAQTITTDSNGLVAGEIKIPVKDGEYPYPDGQRWADPDLEQAAWFMRKLVSEREYGLRLGERAAEYIRTHHSFRAVGERYRRRLTKLGFLSNGS